SIAAGSAAGPNAAVPYSGAPDVVIPAVNRVSGMHAADFNRDGRIDLAVLGGKDARIVILLNRQEETKGGGGFRSAAEFDAGPGAGTSAPADFNEDGFVDLAVPHHDIGEVWVFPGKGDGTFGEKRVVSVAAKKPHLHMVAAADVNADKHQDLLLAQSDDNQV